MRLSQCLSNSMWIYSSLEKLESVKTKLESVKKPNKKVQITPLANNSTTKSKAWKLSNLMLENQIPRPPSCHPLQACDYNSQRQLNGSEDLGIESQGEYHPLSSNNRFFGDKRIFGDFFREKRIFRKFFRDCDQSNKSRGKT